MTIARSEGTVIGGWAVAIARAMDHYKLDPEQLFRANGINLSRALDTNARFPVTRINQVLQAAAASSGDECFGLVVAKYVRPTSWHALGISIWASTCMEEAFDRLVRGQRMFDTTLNVRMEREEAGAALHLRFADAYQDTMHPLYMDAVMATVALTGRHIAEGQFRFMDVAFTREPPEKIEGFERLFRCPVRFSAPENRMRIGKSDLTKPLPTRNAELAMLNDRLVAEYLARLDRHDVVNQVYSKLMEQLGGSAASQEQIAQALHISPRNLQRKLQQAGTSYQEILDQLRQELALEYLRQSHLSINQITFLLGFSKPGSFTRAFTRWKGISPQKYREKRLH